MHLEFIVLTEVEIHLDYYHIEKSTLEIKTNYEEATFFRISLPFMGIEQTVTQCYTTRKIKNLKDLFPKLPMHIIWDRFSLDMCTGYI